LSKDTKFDSRGKISKSWFNLRKVRDLNFKYLEIKELYKKAINPRKKTGEYKTVVEIKEDWEKAKEAYVDYFKNYYEYDTDALEEASDIYSNLGDFKNAIKCIETAQKRQKGNPSHYIRLGINYSKDKKWKKALDEFLELVNKEEGISGEENERLLLNIATCCIKIIGHRGIGEPDRKGERLEILEKVAKRLEEIKPDTRDTTSVSTSLENIKKNQAPLSDHKVKNLTKAKTGDASRLTSELRLGVLIYLHMYEGATPYIIRDAWLGSKTVCDDILNQLEKGEYIEKILELPGKEPTPVYGNTELGESYGMQFLNTIFNLEFYGEKVASSEIKKTSDIVNNSSLRQNKENSSGAIFTEKLVDKVMDWLAENDKGYQLSIEIEDEEGNPFHEFYFFKNQQKLEEFVPELKIKVKKLSGKAAKDLELKIKAIEGKTYCNKL